MWPGLWNDKIHTQVILMRRQDEEAAALNFIPQISQECPKTFKKRFIHGFCILCFRLFFKNYQDKRI